jgi:hypothetical protein
VAAVRSTLQDPGVVSSIGPYDELPGLEVEKGQGPMRLGSEGVWPCGADAPILWREVTALRVSEMGVEGTTFAMVEANTRGSSLVSPVCLGLPGQAFESRASLIADRLLQHAVNQGIDKADWPVVDLTPRPDEPRTPEQASEVAAGLMTQFEVICPHGVDPVLGRYVEIGPNDHRLWVLTGSGILYFVAGVLIFLSLQHGSRGVAALLFGLLASVVGAWYLLSSLWMRLSWRRLRVGENGLQLLPVTGPILWSDIASAGVSRVEVGLRLRIGMSSAGPGESSEHTYRLAPLRAPGEARAAFVEVTVLIEAMLDASRPLPPR